MNQVARAAGESLDRGLVATAYLVVWVVFFAVQRIFAGFSHRPSLAVMGLIGLAILVRIGEIAYFHRNRMKGPVQAEHLIARISIASTFALAMLLAIASREPDTPYFGVLMLPILETAVYFSLFATLAVAAMAASFSIFWVFYAGHFHPPFAVGEMLESATLVLVFFIVGSLVWLLMDRIRQRSRELGHRMDDLEQTRNRLVEEEKLAAVGRLASSIAHEIRNPVAIISSALEAAESIDFAQPERTEMSHVAMTEARRLEKLASDFLSYANLSAEPFETLDLGTLAGYVGGIVRVQAVNKNLQVDLRVETGEHCTVRGNEGQLQQVLLNLMRNAVDAAPQGSRIGVHVYPSATREAVITIENEGPPIPNAAVHRIFEPFFTNKPNGTGLGLAIAKRIVERHKGQLTLQQNETNRVVFALRIPAAVEQACGNRQ